MIPQKLKYLFCKQSIPIGGSSSTRYMCHSVRIPIYMLVDVYPLI